MKCLLDCAGYGPAARLQGIYTCTYSDAAAIPEADLGYAAIAQALGMVRGSYQGDRTATRGELAAMLCRLLERQGANAVPPDDGIWEELHMKNVFGYPEFDAEGEEILCTYDNAYSDMLMDIRVYRMEPGRKRGFCRRGEETAVLLLSGTVTFGWEGWTETVSRRDVFTDGPYALHACAGEEITVEAQTDAEILVQCTKNDTAFSGRLYRPEDAPWVYSCVGKFGNVDKDIAPWSNMVLGEVLNDRGNWSGYLPHRHPQPECYYFKFDRPEGFGASFVGDQVFKSVDNSFSAIPGGCLHPQAVAPGFQMYTCWMIRHLDGNPWLQTTRNEDERYLWLHDAQE